ncbi:hypothetical protein ACF0H5_004673 [Mactra antiquata]
MTITRTTYQLGTYVSVEVHDHGLDHIEIALIQTIYENDLLKKDDYTMTLQRYQQLVWQTEAIKEVVRKHKSGEDVQYSWHLGGNNFVQVNSGFPVVDLRKFWLPEWKDQLQPTRRGIPLKFDEFETLVELKAEIEQVIPELDQTQPCWMGNDHMNQLGYLMCPECNPNDYLNW